MTSSALKPIDIDCPRATTPRITGQRSARLRRVHETTGCDSTAISPSLRVATDQVETPRIITPSRTAWPPTGASRCSGLLTHGDRQPGARAAAPAALVASCAAADCAQLALEALDASAGVDQLLLAGVERVAVGADLHVDVALGGTSHELVPAGAATLASLYSGWISVFMALPIVGGRTRPQQTTLKELFSSSASSTCERGSATASQRRRPRAHGRAGRANHRDAASAAPARRPRPCRPATPSRRKSTANGPAASRPRLKTTRDVAAVRSTRTLRMTRSGRASGCLQTGEIARSVRIVLPRAVAPAEVHDRAVARGRAAAPGRSCRTCTCRRSTGAVIHPLKPGTLDLAPRRRVRRARPAA